MTKQLLTNSRRQALMTCPRKHQFMYELGIRPDYESKPLRFGGVFHDALDNLAQGKPLDEVLFLAREAYYKPPEWCNTEELVLEWYTEAETVAVLVEGYHWRWQNDQVKVLATEQSFNVPLKNPETGHESKLYELGGKIDKIALWRSILAVMEHKTTSEPIEGDADYWKRLTLDSQISIYVIAARALGFDVSTVLYDVVRKPSIDRKMINDLDEQGRNIVLDPDGKRVFTTRGANKGEPRQTGDPKKGYELQRHRETPEEFGQRLLQDIYDRPHYYYQRREIPRLDADITEAAYELWHTQKLLRECQRGGRWPRNTHACLKPFRCPYTDICFNGINPEKSLPEGFVRIDNVHPEL